MAQTGPVTKDTSSIPLGLAKIRVAAYTGFKAIKGICLSGEAMSIGALSNTKYKGETEWYRHLSGFPQLEDYVIALKDSAALEVAVEELNPFNLAMSLGYDPTLAAYSAVHSGEIALGNRTASVFVRVEAEYTFPNGTNKMIVIFPKAQVTSSVEFDYQKDTGASIPLTFESKRNDTETQWANAPLGCVVFT